MRLVKVPDDAFAIEAKVAPLRDVCPGRRRILFQPVKQKSNPLNTVEVDKYFGHHRPRQPRAPCHAVAPTIPQVTKPVQTGFPACG
jgi:hypothetical protein